MTALALAAFILGPVAVFAVFGIAVALCRVGMSGGPPFPIIEVQRRRYSLFAARWTGRGHLQPVIQYAAK